MSISKAQHEALKAEMRRATIRVVEVALEAHAHNDRIRILRDAWRSMVWPQMGDKEQRRELGT